MLNSEEAASVDDAAVELLMDWVDHRYLGPFTHNHFVYMQYFSTCQQFSSVLLLHFERCIHAMDHEIVAIIFSMYLAKIRPKISELLHTKATMIGDYRPAMPEDTEVHEQYRKDMAKGADNACKLLEALCTKRTGLIERMWSLYLEPDADEFVKARHCSHCRFTLIFW